MKVRGTGPLQEKYFYITIDTNNAAKLQDNATKFAKTLLHGAFSDEALYYCSLKGGEYRAAGKGKFTRKPALDQGILALIVGKWMHDGNLVFDNRGKYFRISYFT